MVLNFDTKFKGSEDLCLPYSYGLTESYGWMVYWTFFPCRSYGSWYLGSCGVGLICRSKTCAPGCPARFIVCSGWRCETCCSTAQRTKSIRWIKGACNTSTGAVWNPHHTKRPSSWESCWNGSSKTCNICSCPSLCCVCTGRIRLSLCCVCTRGIGLNNSVYICVYTTCIIATKSTISEIWSRNGYERPVNWSACA